MILAASPANAGAVDPSLRTPEEQSRQINLDAQQQQRKQEMLRQLKQQQESKPDVRDDVDQLMQQQKVSLDSRGGMTIGNALETQLENGASDSLSQTTIQL